MLRDREGCFTRSRADVEQYVQNAGVPLFSNMEYIPISFSEERYRDQANRGELAEQVYDAISKKQQDGSPYRDLSALKQIADSNGIAILLIHHLRKEPADDVFNRISGTTAISGAVDSSFTLVEDKRGSGKAKLSCIGRDIEYRELILERSDENVWEMISDSRTQPELLGDRIVCLLSELMRTRKEFIGTPTELSELIDPVGVESITPKKVSRLILQNLDALSKIGIFGVVRRSNGKRLIELHRAESDAKQGALIIDPVDPVGAAGGGLREVSGCGE